ncbi:LOW QUALITY PROTEIN: pentatricopeptide repeat-containing protein At1g55630-like [Dioscorea cayenensis subsp. rotundata]|uniref:LOW QUALITY PROTEIN: pentatricopeptide repeat-containing protein At1g55630-like n=1 Tax=Dioscorea cayennensis subsp. rotundata TaxID=55577 RepID=A0AB40BYB9_DIOCR|nr:LOW QUALITY PROTEIN: pentatricopeptide repeat-containing protein At1g55630-like [Dioscorea cayenensis subsp. rotundata]
MLLLRFSPRSILTPRRRRLLSSSGHRPPPPTEEDEDEDEDDPHPSSRRRQSLLSDADQIISILKQDGLGFEARTALNDLHPNLTAALVHLVLRRIHSSMTTANKSRSAKLAFKFFAWASDQPHYSHPTHIYNLTMKIFSDADELKNMFKLLNEMTIRGLPITAHTLQIIICSCGQAGLARNVVERFIRSNNFNFRPFKSSFNAILHSLLTIDQFRLIEWVHQQMLAADHSPDTLTYNILMFAKLKLGKPTEFYNLITEMAHRGIPPDLHTYNLILHVLGKGDNPAGATKLLNNMEADGCRPSVLHFTNLIDGLSRAGNLRACEHFFDEMKKNHCEPDVVCYTVMINGYLVAGEFGKAQELFDEMLVRGHLPNVFTYNSMIRGLCVAEKFDEACAMLKEMDARGCTPNFSVYSTLVGRLRRAGRVAQARAVIGYMVDKGHYLHLVSKFKGYRRC